MSRYIIIFLLGLNSTSLAATDWSDRLKPTTEIISQSGKTRASFELNCDRPFQQISTKNFQKGENTVLVHPPQTECLKGTFKRSVYYKRGQEDPIAYRTYDGKPYLEFYFSGWDNFVPKTGPGKQFTLKLIAHDFKGKGKYLIFHQNETYRPRYNEKQMIVRTKNGFPMLNWNADRNIPMIIGSFAALREANLVDLTNKELASGQYLDKKSKQASAVTYTSGDRLYGSYTSSDLKKIMLPQNKLGEIEISEIDPNGQITGSFNVRLIRETCNDILQIGDCQTDSVFFKAQFSANEFKPNKKYIKEGLLKKPKLLPRLKLGTNDGSASNTSKPSSREIISDSIEPRMHKPLLGYQCKAPIAKTCKASEGIFERYIGCMKKYNFKRNDAQDTARKNLRSCHQIYLQYAEKSKSCRKLFTQDSSCKQ
jgi:hypothetical protein